MSKKVLVALMNGFEETEYIAVRDVLIREGIEVESISLTGEKLLIANHNTQIAANFVHGKQNITLDDYDGLFIPGGLIGVENLDNSEVFEGILNDFYMNNKFIGAICAAPMLLAKRGMLKGKRATCFPENKIINTLLNNECEYINDVSYITDGKIVTGKDMTSSIIYGYELANKINDWK